jgi:hypothetical protein
MGKKKPIYNNVQKQSVVNKLKKGHVSKPRKVVVTILSPQEIKS